MFSEKALNFVEEIEKECKNKFEELEKIVVRSATILNISIDKEQENIEAKDIEGRVIAKRKIVDKIKAHTNISLNRTTPMSAHKFNLFFINLK